jgi:hypothetical protein
MEYIPQYSLFIGRPRHALAAKSLIIRNLIKKPRLGTELGERQAYPSIACTA